jgi:hypothetical protein
VNLQHEVRHKSEDISDDVLRDVVKAIGRRVRTISREYDIPYIAGHSVDGRAASRMGAALRAKNGTRSLA